MTNGYMGNQRVPVLDSDGYPLMPTKYKRAIKWIKNNKAKIVRNDLKIFCVKLIEPAMFSKTQKIVLGIDPGRCYTGMAVQSKKNTLLGVHIKLPELQKKTNKRTTKFGQKIRSDIKKNRMFENFIVNKIIEIFPIREIVYEMDITKKEKKFWNPTIVGQHWQYERLNDIAKTYMINGVMTSNIRKNLGLIKQKKQKGQCKPETQVVDGIALAHYRFSRIYKKKINHYCRMTNAPFTTITKDSKNYFKKNSNVCFCSNSIKNMDYIDSLVRNNYE